MHTATMSTASVLPPPQQHSASVSAMSTSQQYEPGGMSQQMFPTANNGPQPHQNGFGQSVSAQHISPFYGPNFPQPNPGSQMIYPQNVAAASSAQQQTTNSFDPRNLEIKTRSVEQTLLPLVQQISTLVNFKESIIAGGGRSKSGRPSRAAKKIGFAVEAAVERFVVVGETIADENPDIQPELYDACHEARIAGSSIANLHNSMWIDQNDHQIGGSQPENGGGGTMATVDTAQLVRAARQLLSSVTRVLLLADRVLVKHILRAEDKIAYSLTKLEHTSNFSEFVQIFTEFGGQMVDLAHRSGDRQQDLKSEKRQAQMQVARAQLERLTMLLLTSSKTLLRHPDDPAARQCRDGVFHQIRSALQLISVCVTDGVMNFDYGAAYSSPMDEISRNRDGPLDIGIQLTASVAIRQLTEMLDMCRMMSMIGAGVRERLVSALGALCEMSADFTESAWTPHQQREQILDLLEECRFEMGNLVNPPPNELGNDERLRSESIEVTVERLNRRLKDLRKQLQVVALEQIAQVFRQNDDQTILSSMKTCSISGDIDGVERFLEQFRLHAEHLQEVCRLLHHISLTDALHVFTGHAERNLRALAPLTLLAGRVLCVHPSSKIARENLEVFCDTWATNVNDLARLTKELDAACSGRLAAEKQAYMSLPRPGVSPSSVSFPPLPTTTSPSSSTLSSISGFCREHFSGAFNGVFGVGGVLPQYPIPLIYGNNANNIVPVLCQQSPNYLAQIAPLMCQSSSSAAIGPKGPANGMGQFHPTGDQSPMPMQRLARAASIPSSTMAQNEQKNGEIRSKTPVGEAKKQQFEEIEEKMNGKRKKKLRKEERKMDEDENGEEKKGTSRMSFSALFRRIRRESSQGRKKNAKKGKNKDGKGEEGGEWHSDGEALEQEKNGRMAEKEEENEANLNGFSQSSRSLRLEIIGNEKEEKVEEKPKHSPLYAQIKKMSTQTTNHHQQNGNIVEESPMTKSAFTPYGQFHSQQKEKQQILLSPPRPKVEQSVEEEKWEMKFNRIQMGESVIVRQESEPSTSVQRHGTTSKPTKPITLDAEDQQKIAKVGLEMKLLTDEMEAEAENWDKYAENDIVKRAKAMSAMSYNMYLFTKGDGPLKTTHDLFTQAEFFAEQANKMHKTVREFAFEVPGSAEKNELLQILEKIPIHCQQLQVLVKSPTVGKTATFTKVDAVISETKGLMNEIAKLVTACFVCATKFEIEFRGNLGPRPGVGEGELTGDYSQRASRESSAVWRRTPSMRRPAAVQQNYLTASGSATATAGGDDR